MITENRAVTITPCKMALILNGLQHPSREGSSTRGLESSKPGMCTFIAATLCRLELKRMRCGDENPGQCVHLSEWVEKKPKRGVNYDGTAVYAVEPRLLPIKQYIIWHQNQVK